MKTLRACLLLVAAAVLSGCTPRGGNTLASKEQILYYDRNGDGKVDLEKHHYRDTADADWELQDNDHDGRYEKKILFGVGVTESAVDLPVPKKVRIEPKQ